VFWERLFLFKEAECLVTSAAMFLSCTIKLQENLYFKFNQASVLEVKLKLEDTFRKNPQLAQIEIKRPMFIVGLPRTGSTLLSRILSQDPRFRTTYLYETMEPFPAPHPDTFFANANIDKVSKDLAFIQSLMPDMKKVHTLGALEQEEDMALLHREFLCYMLAFWGDWPEYKNWVFNGDARPAYANHKRFIQHLSTNFSPSLQWLLKCPAHSNYLEAIVATYPDALFINLHRDLRQSVASTISLATQLATPFVKKISKKKIGRMTVDICADGVDRLMESRDKLQKDHGHQFVDIQYKDMMDDIIREVRKIYTSFGIELLPSVEDAMKKWLKENPQGKHGRHKYSLEEYGFTEEEILERFKPYIDRFNIPHAK